MPNQLTTLLFCFFLSFSAMADNHRGGAELLNPKAYAVYSSAMVFQTASHYNVNGEEVEMAEGAEYRLIDIDLALSYGVSRNVEVTGFARMRNLNSTLNEVSATKSGLESLALEGKYAFEKIGKLRYAMGVHYRQTLYSNTTADGTVQLSPEELALGDAGSEYGIDFYATYLDNPLKWDVKLGYSSPANDLSDEIIYKFQTMYSFSKLGIFAGVEGILSLNKDEYTNDPAQKPVQSTGASSLFNSVNREKMAPYIGINMQFDKAIIELRGQTVVSGKSTDKGHSAMFGLGWNSDGVTPESVKIGSFKEYHIDGSVLKVSARNNFVKIDQGLSTDVEKGMKFDIYQTDYFGGNVLVATGVAYDVGADWSIIKLTKKFKEIEIKPGFAARGY